MDGERVPHLGLGRRLAEDPRDASFPMAAVLPAKTPERDWRYWHQGGWWGDQGYNPWCVAYAWMHWAEDGPVTQRGAAPIIDPGTLYCEAQSVDEWPGDCTDRRYDGTSVRAGAKVLQRRGLIDSYRWAWDVEAVIQALLTTGPVVLGTWWYESMFYPSPEGYISLWGRRAGGHAYVANGINRRRGVIRLKNSWGREWGRRGNFWMRIEDVERLIKEDGEACLAVERRVAE